MSEYLNTERTYIGTSTIIEGNDGEITCGGDIEIKGQVKCNIHTSGSFTLSGTVEGNIDAAEVTIEGNAKLNGNVEAKKSFAISEGSHLTGNIKTNKASVNASILGNIDVASDLEMYSDGQIVGNINTGSIYAEKGAVIQGSVAVKNFNK